MVGVPDGIRTHADRLVVTSLGDFPVSKFGAKRSVCLTLVRRIRFAHGYCGKNYGSVEIPLLRVSACELSVKCHPDIELCPEAYGRRKTGTFVTPGGRLSASGFGGHGFRITDSPVSGGL